MSKPIHDGKQFFVTEDGYKESIPTPVTVAPAKEKKPITFSSLAFVTVLVVIGLGCYIYHEYRIQRLEVKIHQLERETGKHERMEQLDKEMRILEMIEKVKAWKIKNGFNPNDNLMPKKN